jgi:hypothetical protein
MMTRGDFWPVRQGKAKREMTGMMTMQDKQRLPSIYNARQGEQGMEMACKTLLRV